jgi:GTP cyclohydrolase I
MDHFSITEAIKHIIEIIGDDPNREGLLDTPNRVSKSYKELFSGYSGNPKETLSRVFTCKNDEMVILKDIEFFSTCEHHMIPFFGKVHIGYIPDGKVVGISKLARLVEVYARRLQIQEQMTDQIADAIVKYLAPKGVIVVVEATHLCMRARGVQKQNSTMITSAIRGVFKKQHDTRAEFLSLIK